jgi:hypothetical protein
VSYVNLEPLINIAKEKGLVEKNQDYGAGPIDLIWNEPSNYYKINYKIDR